MTSDVKRSNRLLSAPIYQTVVFPSMLLLSKGKVPNRLVRNVVALFKKNVTARWIRRGKLPVWEIEYTFSMILLVFSGSTLR